MEAKNLNRLSLAVGILGIVALAAAGGLYVRGNHSLPPTPAVVGSAQAEESANASAPPGEAAHAEAGGHETGEAEASDLDRPVDEMWAQKCEHNVLQYECDECRYEIGAVKLPAALLGKGGKGGLASTTQARPQTFSEEILLTGEVQLSEAKTVHVTSPLPGTLRSVPVGLGRRVSAGDVLFQVDSHEVAQAKADYLKAQAALVLTRRTAEREATLFAKKISAEAEVEEAEARRADAEVDVSNARAKLLRMGLSAGDVAGLSGQASAPLSGVVAVRAPRAGVVLEQQGVAGEYLEAGKDVLLLSDLSEVWVWANLKESDLQAASRAGGRLAAVVEAPATGRTFRGSVDLVSGTMEEATRTVKARIVLAAGGALRPGMFVKVKLLVPGGQGALAVPKVAVLADEGRPFVFVHKEGDYWVRRPVTLGKREGDRVEILGGLKAGQTLIADGSFLLKSDVLRAKMGAGCAD